MEEEEQSTPPPEVEEVAQQEAPDSQTEAEEVDITLGEESLTAPRPRGAGRARVG